MPPLTEKKSQMPESSSTMLPPVFRTPCTVLEPPAYGQYYVYSSNPKLAAGDRPKTKGTGKARGAHDYHSMMWDPRIYRGPTYKTFRVSEQERCKRKSLEDAKTSNSQRKKGLGKRRVQHQQLGGIVRPRTPPHQSGKVGLEDMGIQTDKFLEEITDEVKEKDICTQTDHIFDLPVEQIFCSTKLGVDVETQILPWELFNFDEEVSPIVTTVVGKIIEQALFEIMEEVELESLIGQQRAFEERHRVELMRLERLNLREQKIAEERKREIAQRKIEVKEEKEVENVITASLYAANTLGRVANNALQELRQEGFMAGNNSDLQESFIPWLNEESLQKFATQDRSITLLDEIIQSVVDKREAEVADGIWREISAEKKQPSLPIHEHEGPEW